MQYPSLIPMLMAPPTGWRSDGRAAGEEYPPDISEQAEHSKSSINKIHESTVPTPVGIRRMHSLRSVPN